MVPRKGQADPPLGKPSARREAAGSSAIAAFGDAGIIFRFVVPASHSDWIVDIPMWRRKRRSTFRLNPGAIG